MLAHLLEIVITHSQLQMVDDVDVPHLYGGYISVEYYIYQHLPHK